VAASPKFKFPRSSSPKGSSGNAKAFAGRKSLTVKRAKVAGGLYLLGR
jgi:hypothetical protein